MSAIPTQTSDSSDWRTPKKTIVKRCQYLLETGTWSDCRFQVGTGPNQQIIEGHKLFLAMSSQVFEDMLFGEMAEKDAIVIPDVQPSAFKALLEYIYTDKINLASFDQAYELCYAAKKYMLPHLIETCSAYLCENLNHQNACRAYEFGQLLNLPKLVDKSLRNICNETSVVLSHKTFEKCELNTLITILEQENLQISSELELFFAVQRYANKNNLTIDKTETKNTGDRPTIRDALTKIRFLTLTPRQFAEGPANSNLLTEREKFSILMNISSPRSVSDMPEGFSILKVARNQNFQHSKPINIVHYEHIRRSNINNSVYMGYRP